MPLDVVGVRDVVDVGLRVRLAVEEVVDVGELEAVADRVGVSVDVPVAVAVGHNGLHLRQMYSFPFVLEK